MSRRDTMIQIAQDTLAISKQGEYQIGNRIYVFDTANNTKLFTNMDEVVGKVKEKKTKNETYCHYRTLRLRKNKYCRKLCFVS